MKLHWSPRSPFVRKVMIVLHETGLISEVECVRTVVATNQPPNADLMVDNPLNKIPTLITGDGLPIFDSRVICEFLDMQAGTTLFPAEPDRRIRHLRWQALADGLTEILLLWRIELMRETGPWDAVTSGWLSKIRATMATIDTEAEALAEEPFGIGHIALVCALGQLDFRWSDCNWRDHFPALAALEKNLSKRSSIIAAPISKDDDDESSKSLTAERLTFA